LSGLLIQIQVFKAILIDTAAEPPMVVSIDVTAGQEIGPVICHYIVSSELPPAPVWAGLGIAVTDENTDFV
jgi:hypothetical protein